MCDALGDNIFASPYIIQEGTYSSQFDVSFDKMYHLNHKATNNGQFFGYVTTNFKEYEQGKYYCSFVFLEASSYSNENFLRLGYLNTDYGLMMAELCLSGKLEDFETDTNAEVRDFKCAIFGQERYIITTQIDATTLINFVKNQLNFTKQSFVSGTNVTGGKKATSKQLDLMNKKMQNYNYESAYYQTSQVDVRPSYTIPADTTVVEQYSIPATKKVIIPKEVETIKGNPFVYPEYVEEIVFEDADNGALKTIGAGSDFFILSFTKVKNFVLPKTVEKLYVGMFDLITEMELLDISSCTNLASAELEYMEESGKIDVQNMLPKLSIYVLDFVKEFNYIHTLKLPDADMRLYFSDLGGAHRYNERAIDLPTIPFDYETVVNYDVPAQMNARKNNIEEYGFTFCTQVIGNVYYPKLTVEMGVDTFMREVINPYDKVGQKRYYYSYVNNIYAKESIYNDFKEYVENHTQDDEFNTYLTVCEVKMIVESWYGKTLYCNEGDGYIAKKLDGCTLDENNPDYDKILLSMGYGKYGFVITLNDADGTLTKGDSQYGGYSEVFHLVEHDGKTYVCQGNYYEENYDYGWITFEDDRVLWHEIHNNYKVEFVTVWRLQTTVN